MGLFKDKLFLRLTALATPGGKHELQIEKIDHKYPHILPFSCVSLVGSHLTKLKSHHVRALVNTLLDFIHNPEITYQETGIVNGFELGIYRNAEYLLYNQFDPKVSDEHISPDENHLQADIVRAISNYVVTIYDGSSEPDRIKLLYYLLVTIRFYQQDVFSVINKISTLKEKKRIKKRKRLTRTELTILTTLWQRWKYPVAFDPGSEEYSEMMAEARKFSSYLP